MPKIEEFYQIQYKRWSATRRTRRAHAAQARALRERVRCGRACAARAKQPFEILGL